MRSKISACASVVVFFGGFACDAPATDGGEAARRGLLQSGAIEGEGPPIGRRWVLRDADGAPVNAVVEPTCRADGPACAINDVGTVGGITPECARVVWHGDEYVDLKYNLSSGRPEECAPSFQSPMDFAIFADEDCAGPFYSLPGSGTESAYRFVRRARFVEDDATLYYQSDAVLTNDSWFGGETCQPFTEMYTVSQWLPVPDWALQALLGPPYSLHWE